MSEVDTTAVSELIFELLDNIRESYSEWKDVEFGITGVIIEVTGKPPIEAIDGDLPDDDEEVTATTITYRCSDPRHWIQEAFFRKAWEAVDQ